MQLRFVLTTLQLVILMLGARPAWAEVSGVSVALNQFDPAPAGDPFFSIPSPATRGELVPRFSGIFDYASQPLVLKTGPNTSAIVSNQGFFHVGLSLAMWNRLLVSGSLPIALIQQGNSPVINGVAFESPSGPAVGDLRIQARIRIFGENTELLQVALGASVYAPLQRVDSYVSDNALRIAGEVVVGGRSKRYIWSVMLRPMFRASSYPTTLNHGIAIGRLFADGQVQLGLEFFASTPLQKGYLQAPQSVRLPRGFWSNMELHASVRACLAPRIWTGIAGGPGLSSEMGTPQFRLVGMLGWSDSCPR